MATELSFLATKRYAVVTGANKGIGFEICKQLASKGVMVVLTARDEKRGLEAIQRLKEFGLSENVVFHQLDIVNSFSIASLAGFIKTQFGKLDILVNNAATDGAIANVDAMQRAVADGWPMRKQEKWTGEIYSQTYELAESCLKTNYYGAKGMVEGLLPLIQLSDSARIINVSSSIGMLKNIPNEWAKEILSDVEKLTEERVDEVLNEFLKDFKQGTLESKGWPSALSAYIVSKAATNAYSRIMAKKYPNFRINSACPGFVKTDMNFNTGIFTVEEGAECPVWLALVPANGGPSGFFFNRQGELQF